MRDACDHPSPSWQDRGGKFMKKGLPRVHEYFTGRQAPAGAPLQLAVTQA
jgi:hypothetical protein